MCVACRVNTKVHMATRINFRRFYFLGIAEPENNRYKNRTETRRTKRSNQMRDTEASFLVRTTCCDWYTGTKSAMFAVFSKKPFKPKKLYAEVKTALADGSTRSKAQTGPLQAVLIFARQEIALENALDTLKKAAKLARDAGLLLSEAKDTIGTGYDAL